MYPSFKLQRVCVDGFEGSWSEIASMVYQGVILRLVEHDQLGQAADCLIVVANGHSWEGCRLVALVLDDVANGFDDLKDLGDGELDRQIRASLDRIENDRLAAEHIERSTALFAAAAAKSTKGGEQ